VSEEMKVRSQTNPVVVKSGEQYYSVRKADDVGYVLVPTKAMTDAEQVKASEEQKKRLRDKAKKDAKLQAKLSGLKIVETEGSAAVQPEEATGQDLQMYAGRIITPDGNTLPHAQAKHAASVKNTLSQMQEQTVQEQSKPIKSLTQLPGGTPPSASGFYGRPVQFMSVDETGFSTEYIYKFCKLSLPVFVWSPVNLITSASFAFKSN